MLSAFQSQKPGFRLPGANKPEVRQPKYSPAPGTKAKEVEMTASLPHPDPGAVTCPRIVGGDPFVPTPSRSNKCLPFIVCFTRGARILVLRYTLCTMMTHEKLYSCVI